MRTSRRALAYFRPDWPLVLALLGLIVLSTAVGLLVAWPMAILVDSVFGHGKDDLIHRVFVTLLPADKPAQIFALAFIGLGLKLLQDLLGIAQTVVSNHLHYRGLLRVRCDLFRKLQSMNLDFHRSQPQGDSIYRLTADTFGCQHVLGTFVSLAAALLLLANILWILLTRDVTLTLLALSITPVLVALNLVFARRFMQRTLDCKRSDTEFTMQVQRSIASIGLIQAFRRESDEFRRFHASASDTIASWWKLNRQQLAYNLLIGMTFGVGGAIVFGYGGYTVYRDSFVAARPGGLTIGDLMIFMSYLGMLWGPLCTLTGFSSTLAAGKAGATRVFEVLDRDPVIVDRPGAVPLDVKPRTIRFDDVWLGYDKASPVLRGLACTIAPGEMVAFVGSSGVGKSTLLNLLPRFYDPDRGAMRFDEVDLREARLADVRRHVAIVLQESVLLPSTIAENIAYGRTGATMAEIVAAAETAGAHAFIEQLPRGYETVVQEGASNLSGGQRQRIAIARALLSGAPVLLLDEPTSALDPEHERRIVEALRAIKGSRTVVLVSHRMGTVMDADRVFVMEAGRVVESGPPAELLARGGAFARLAGIDRLRGAAPDRVAA
jgi:subfamily B ATP-binding cassette protein MsbA